MKQHRNPPGPSTSPLVVDTEPLMSQVICQPCTYNQIMSPTFQHWCDEIQHPHMVHRKLWEWCYILQALDQSNMIENGKRGLGFGVGIEPITALLAANGCRIRATDMPSTHPDAASWDSTAEHAKGLDDMNTKMLCPPPIFRKQVEFEPVDMNCVPGHLVNFDFLWSSCCFEHLGDLQAGLDFVLRSLDCLRPGGIAVHTTEYCVSSDYDTITKGDIVAYRRRDLTELLQKLSGQGHEVLASFKLGTSVQDLHVDRPPYSLPHIRLLIGDIVLTSFGLLIRKTV